MFGILVSAGNAILQWLLRGVVIKFLILTGIYYVITWIAEAVLNQLDISPLTGLQSVLDALPVGVLWFLGIFRLDVGFPLVLGAMLTKFIIRRIPVIG